MSKKKHQRKVLGTLVASGILMSQFPAHAQFNKYRSQTRFNPENAAARPPTNDPVSAQPETESMSAEDAAAALKAAEKIENAAPPINTDIDSDEDSSAFETDNDDEANQTTFGDRPSPELNAQPKNAKYVNLNPETAFGPEIVQSFDFPDTDIMEITKHMQKLTGINLILDKDVKGKVSILAPTPITVGDAWKAYLAALNMAGYSLIKTGAFYKVINARDIRYTPTKIYTGNYTPDTENYVMRVIALKSVSAAEIARNFRPFMSRYGRIIDIKQTNTIIIADTGSNINRLAKMVKFLDIPGHEESLQIVKVKNSSAQEIAKLLDNILKGGSGAAGARVGTATPRFSTSGGSETSTSSISRIIAEPRTNSIIAMANAEGAQQLKELINKLDVKLVSSSSNRVHVYYLNYGDSEELSKTLSSIVSGATQSAGGAGGAAGGATRFSSFSSGGDSNPIFSAEVKITSDKNNNALVVTASPTDWLTLRDVIGRLDIPRDQVYVEGLILEANVSKNRAFGVEYVGAYGQGNAQRTGFTSSSSSTNGLLGLLSNGIPQSLGGFVAGMGIGPRINVPVTSSSGTTAGATSTSSTIRANAVNALIKAVASHGNTNILATPQILALDNAEATFEVGDTQPVQNFAQNGTSTIGSTTTQEAKLSLKITPQINKVTRFVKLKINQKIDDFKASGQASTGARPTTTRSAITEVMVRDRDTIAMGGLLRDKETVEHNKIPILGDIPVIGWLFKNQTRAIEKINLLFFMTPRILAPYQKTASANTKEVLTKRRKAMEGMFDDDQTDPNQKFSEHLDKKLDKQIEGPLYDKADAEIYKNLNNRAVRQGSDDQETESTDANATETPAQPTEEFEVPDYQEIRKSVQ